MSYDIGLATGLNNPQISDAIKKSHDMPSAEAVSRSVAKTDNLPLDTNSTISILSPIDIVESCDTLYGQVYSAGVPPELSITENIQGRAAYLFRRPESGTTTNAVRKSTAKSFVPENMGTIAMYIKREIAEEQQVLLSFGNDDVYPELSFAIDFLTIPHSYPADSGFWWAFHISERAGMYAQEVTNCVQLRSYNNAGGVGDVTIDCISMNAQSKPKFVIGFDDANESIYTIAFPKMQSLGLVGTIYVPTGLIGSAGKLTWSQISEMQAAGWGISLNGTPDDSDMTSASDVATAVSIIQSQITTLIANNVDSDDMYHMAYPNGSYYSGDPEFANGLLQQGLSNAGFKTGRTTATLDYLTTFGFANNEMGLSGKGLTSATLNNSIDFIDLIVLRGTTLEYYIHDIQADPVGWDGDTQNSGINCYESTFNGIVEKLAFCADNNIAEVMTKAKLFDVVEGQLSIDVILGK